MKVIGVILILTLFVLLIVNTGITLYRWIKTGWRCGNPRLFFIIFGLPVIAILSLFVLSRVPHIPIPRFLLQGAHYGLGVFLYTVLFVNLTALLLSLGKLSRLVSQQNTAVVSGTAFLLCSLLVAGLSVYGIVQAKTIRKVTYTVSVNRNTGRSETKIALISDLHIGYIVDEAHLQKVVSAINATKPDVVCIAGDIFDGDFSSLSDPEELKVILRSIEAPVYACLGNHDAGRNYDRIPAFLADAGIHLLLDEAVTFDDRLLIVGRRDSSPIGGHDGVRAAIDIPADNALPVVVLDHQPANISEYQSNVDLILCGHTHKGQLFPVNLITNQVFKVDYGYYRENPESPQVIVTSGAGTWGPVLRVGSSCEVAEIIIRS